MKVGIKAQDDERDGEDDHEYADADDGGREGWRVHKVCFRAWRRFDEGNLGEVKAPFRQVEGGEVDVGQVERIEVEVGPVKRG